MLSKRSIEEIAPPVSSRDFGVYVHFPYCEKKCPYCDFNSHAVEHDDGAYADAVIGELSGRAEGLGPARSLYFGGGTPSLWAPAAVARVIGAVSSITGLADAAEITLEANPGTVGEDRFDRYREAGVNRFSIGAQSFSDAELESLGRIHDARASRRAVLAAKATGARVSLDLIYALPGQRFDDVRRSLDAALALDPGHVSAYALTIEPDTALGRRTRLGLFAPMDDDRQADLIERASSELEERGYRRYEISSYARPGLEAVHNSLYWVGGAYLGLGAGAHSYLFAPDLSSAIRRENVRAPEAYLRGARDGTFPATFTEKLDRAGLLADRLMVALRTRWGFDPRELAIESGLGPTLDRCLLPALERLERAGLVMRRGPRAIPTGEGFLRNDTIARTLLLAARELAP